MHSKTYYPGLDAVRFFAACLVLSFHMGFWCWAGHGTTDDIIFGSAARFDELGPYCWFGGVGVQIFFVISGFVIAASACKATATEFARSRFLRLYPGAWVCATTTFLFAVVITAPISDNAYVRSLSLWFWGPWVDGSYWTLPIELCFYALIWALLMLSNFERIAWIAGTLTMISVAYNGAAFFGYQISQTEPIIGIIQRNHSFLLLNYGCFFAFGIWTWLAVERGSRLALAFGGLAAVGCLVQMDRTFTVMSGHSIIHAYWTGTALTPILIWLLASVFILWSARSQRHSSLSGQNVLRVLGLMTYPLYLLHDAIGAGLMRIFILDGVSPVFSLCISVGILITASFAVCMYAEPALRRLLRGLPVLAQSPTTAS